MNADLGHAFTKQEDSLLFCTFISRLANDLTLKESNKVAEKNSVIPLIVRSLFDDSDLLTESIDSAFNFESLEGCLAVVTNERRS